MTAADRFDLLYWRLRDTLFRFGRTGVFDFLSLLVDLGLLDAVAGSCYLSGATGPLKGARMVWGRRPVAELDALAANLARELEVPPQCVEDALCNWQKQF